MFNRILIVCLFCVHAQTFALDLEITQGINAALPIAINPFEGSEQQARLIKNVIEHDLQFSGQFKVVSDSDKSENKTISAWRKIGADSVLSGHVQSRGQNQLEVSIQLFDAAARGRLLLAKSYDVKGADLRALAHHLSDEIYEKLTGERGVFSTRIAYILVQRDQGKPRYSLEIADVDGHNPQSLLVSSEPIMSPAWSPDGKQIAYVSFEKKRAQIYTVDVASGKRRLISSFAGINGAPAWSPDGLALTLVLSKSGAPKIYSVTLKTGALKQLTFGKSIDTEPRYSPDGRYLLFTSGRGGSPHVYRLSLDSGKVNRMTFDGNYNARASYTPNQKQIVMLHREDKRFNIGVQDVNTGKIARLTHAPQDESPSVAPNGRLVLYATRHHNKGMLGIVSIDGRIHMRLPSSKGEAQEPAWSPYLG